MKKRILPILLGVIALAAALFGTNYWQKNYLASVSTIQIPVPKADIPPVYSLSAGPVRPTGIPACHGRQGQIHPLHQ